ncbi:MAG: thiamine phosphate synthase [Deltaproteobacteria bacterium]|nr:thiamine phosphate synthase [Deltaproteobacteria bacterium]
MELNRLYLITDRSKTLSRPLEDVVKAALEGGVRFVQLREKDLSGRELFNLARELRELTNRYNAKLLINDRVDIAVAVGADGVHLGRQSVSVQDARRAFESSSFSVGVSTHSLEEALQAESEGADFITFSPVYFTPSKAAYDQPVGIDKLKEVAKAVNIPIFALGGITIANTEDIMKAGVYGVAMISAIMASNDVKKAVEELIMKIAEHRPLATDNRL